MPLRERRDVSEARRGAVHAVPRRVRAGGLAAAGRALREGQAGLGWYIEVGGNVVEEGPSEVNLQWLRLVKDTKAAGQLPSALAVCDVFGSMSMYEEMDVAAAVALSLLLADVADEPWRNKICTFSMTPKFVTMPSATTDNLAERVEQVKGLQWGMNTRDFQAVFDELLSFALGIDLKPDDMVKTLFVFSDMEFDCAPSVPTSRSSRTSITLGTSTTTRIFDSTTSTTAAAAATSFFAFAFPF